jgi:hypothetical protein
VNCCKCIHIGPVPRLGEFTAEKVVEISNIFNMSSSVGNLEAYLVCREFQPELHQPTVKQMATFKEERLRIFGWEAIWIIKVTLLTVWKGAIIQKQSAEPI